MYGVGGREVELNCHSFTHKKIRALCLQLELLSDMKLVTDFNNFTEIKFIGKLGYITIDFNRNAIYTLGIKLTKLEMDIIKDIMTYCSWLVTADEVKKNRQLHNMQ